MIPASLNHVSTWQRMGLVKQLRHDDKMTMKLAVNYSAPLIRLIEQGLVQVDLIKCPDWDGMLQEAKPYGPITIHYDLEVGLGHTFSADLDRIERLKAATGTPYINTHLVTRKNHHPNNPDEIREINVLWRDELQVMIDKFGGRSIALEHYPFTPDNPNIATAADSTIFSNVIRDVDCMLLLDLAHARITANTLNIDVKDYIESLPLDRLVEVHITGIKKHGGILTDHFELSKEDWAVFEWALMEIREGKWPTPRIIAFEYGGVGSTFSWRTDQDVLKYQVPRLYEMVHRDTK